MANTIRIDSLMSEFIEGDVYIVTINASLLNAESLVLTTITGTVSWNRAVTQANANLKITLLNLVRSAVNKYNKKIILDAVFVSNLSVFQTYLNNQLSTEGLL